MEPKVHQYSAHQSQPFILILSQGPQSYFVKFQFNIILPPKYGGFKCLLRSYYKGKVKVNFILEQATKAQRGSRGIALLFSLTSELDGVGDQRHVSADLTPEKTRYPLYRWLGGQQGRSGQVRKISPPQGFDPRAAQPVASRYTECAIPAHYEISVCVCVYIYVCICIFIYIYTHTLISCMYVHTHTHTHTHTVDERNA